MVVLVTTNCSSSSSFALRIAFESTSKRWAEAPGTSTTSVTISSYPKIDSWYHSHGAFESPNGSQMTVVPCPSGTSTRPIET